MEAESPFKSVRMKRRRRAAWHCHVTITAPEVESGRGPKPLLAFRCAQIEFGRVGGTPWTCFLWECYRLPPLEAPATAGMSGVLDSH